MKTLLYFLSFFCLLSCTDSEQETEKTVPIPTKETSIQYTSTPPPPKLSSNNNLGQDIEEEEVLFDTVPILDNKHFACLEFHDIDEVVLSLLRKDKDRFTVLIPKFRERGGFYDTILVQDYNFDGIQDIDFVIRPGCRSGANAIHNIYLKKGKKFKKATIPPYSFLTPVLKEKTIYGIYNGDDDFELIKATWKGSQLLIKELVDIEIIEPNDNYDYYLAKFYTLDGDKKTKVKEDTMKSLPKNYTDALFENILY
jgi:hypothetical protein